MPQLGQRSGQLVLQRDAHARISQYLGDGFPVGIVMCALCFLMWFLTVLKECKALIDLVRAVLALPRAAATELKDNGDTAALRAISTPRRIFVLAVQACTGCAHLGVPSGAPPAAPQCAISPQPPIRAAPKQRIAGKISSSHIVPAQQVRQGGGATRERGHRSNGREATCSKAIFAMSWS